MPLLKDEVSRASFGIFCYSALMTVAAFVFLNAGQSYVLIELLQYPRKTIGHATGLLALADEVVSIFTALAWGVISDRIGRRWVFAAGFAIMAVAMYAYPFALQAFPTTQTMLLTLFSMRLLFAVGASAAADMLTAVSGDYAAEGSRAKVGGIVGTCTGMGALLAAFILTRMPAFFTNMSNRAAITYSFAITASITFVSAILAAIWIRPVREHHMLRSELGIIRRLALGFRSASHPLIFLAYMSGFVARSDSVVLTVFLTPWISNFYNSAHLCSSEACPEVKRLSSTLLGVSHLFTLLGAPVFGVFGDRLGRVPCTMLSAAIGTLAYLALLLVHDPRSTWMYPLMVAAGIADIGMIISSMTLIASLSSARLRGALSGVYSFFGAIGIITASQLGGMLFDWLWPSAAFSVVAISNLVLLVCCILIWTLRDRIGPSPLLAEHQK